MPSGLVRGGGGSGFGAGLEGRPPTRCLGLLDRARSDEDPGVRKAAVQELAHRWKDDPDTLPLLKDRARVDTDNSVRQAAVQELAVGWKGDPDTKPLLRDRARSDTDSDVRIAAVQELARGWKDDPDTLPWLMDRARSDQTTLYGGLRSMEVGGRLEGRPPRRCPS